MLSLGLSSKLPKTGEFTCVKVGETTRYVSFMTFACRSLSFHVEVGLWVGVRMVGVWMSFLTSFCNTCGADLSVFIGLLVFLNRLWVDCCSGIKIGVFWPGGHSGIVMLVVVADTVGCS